MAAIPSLLAESPEALSVSQLKAGLRKGHDLPVQEIEAVLPGKVGMECGIANPRLPRFQPFRVSRRTPQPPPTR